MLSIICALIVGMIIGICLTVYVMSITGTDGTLQIDISNPVKDIYRLDLKNELENLSKKKKIILVVDTKAMLSD